MCGITQAGARQWATIARELKLPLLEHIEFNGFPVIDPSNVEQLTAEFERIREYFASVDPPSPGPGWVTRVEQADAFVRALRPLCGRSDWEASLG
jgi:hypothetical protein